MNVRLFILAVMLSLAATQVTANVPTPTCGPDSCPPAR
jgi:hypothetical protein